MPYRAVLILALTTAPAKAAGTLFANDLALQCSSPEREPRLTCEAFVDGFFAGLTLEGTLWATPEATDESIAALLAMPQEQLGRQEAGLVLGRLTTDRYACH